MLRNSRSTKDETDGAMFSHQYFPLKDVDIQIVRSGDEYVDVVVLECYERQWKAV